MFEGPPVDRSAIPAGEKVPPPFQAPKLFEQRVIETPSRRALIGAINEMTPKRFMVVDVFSKRDDPLAPYTTYEEGDELITRRFRTEAEAQAFADRWNNTSRNTDSDPGVKRYQVRPIDPLRDLTSSILE